MSKYKVHRNVPQLKRPKTVVLSPKAQLYLRYIAGIDASELQSVIALRDRYHRAKYTEENINKITQKTIEQCIRNGLSLALGMNIQKEKEKEKRKVRYGS